MTGEPKVTSSKLLCASSVSRLEVCEYRSSWARCQELQEEVSVQRQMRVSQQFRQSVLNVKSRPAIIAFEGGRRHAPERDVSGPGAHAVVGAASVLQPCLGEFRREPEEVLVVEIEVEAPWGPMRFYDPNMTVDVERIEVYCRSVILRLIKKLRLLIGR